MMWKILFSSASSAQWYTIANMYFYGAFGQLMLEDSQFYFVTFILGPAYVAYFSKVIDEYIVIWLFIINLYSFNLMKCCCLDTIDELV